MNETSHLVALMESRGREIVRRDSVSTAKERAFRDHCITMKQREIDAEYRFLSMPVDAELAAISDDDLLAELS